MSFKSLVNKLVKEGKSREAATKIAGKVANAKMKGAGSGPTAKQKARMKKKSPAKMKKQGYNARLDDSLGAKHGKKKQSMKDRRDESEGMEKSKGRRKFSGNKSSAQGPPDSKKRFKKDESYKVTSTTHPMEKGGPIPGHDKGKKKGSPTKRVKIDPIVKESEKSKSNIGKRRKKSVEVSKTESARGRKVKTKTKEVTNRKGVTTKTVKRKTSGTGGRSKTKTVTKTDTQRGRGTRPEDKRFINPRKPGDVEPTTKVPGSVDVTRGGKKKGSPAKRFQAYDQMDTRNAAQTAGSPMGMYGKHSPANMSGQSYDAKEAYNKNLSASARLHYLENNRADAKAKKGGHAIHKHMGGRR